VGISRRRGGAWLLIAVGAIWVAWQGGHYQTMGDYPREFAASTNALLAGHVNAFVAHLPSDGAGGSVLLLAPAALLGKLLVGSQLAIFHANALASELAAGVLGMALARDMRTRGLPLASRVATVGLCMLLAALLNAITFGHPEETLGGALCVGAVLLAGAGRPTLAGLMLGGALINKPWGVLAIPAVALANPAALGATGLGAAAVLVPWLGLALGLNPAHFKQSVAGASSAVLVAHPADLWWPFAHAVRQAGTTPYSTPPHFLVHHARELAVLIAIPLSLPLTLKRLSKGSALDPRAGTDAALALLALLFLLRCALDPSDHVYYSVPFVLALLAWESRVRQGPVCAMLAAGLLWLIFHTISGIASDSVQFLAYTAVTVPFATLLLGPASVGALRPRWPQRRSRPRGRALRRAPAPQR
jgi:hypothetical protein